LVDGGFVFIWPNTVNDYPHLYIIAQRYNSSYRKYDEILKVKTETFIKGLAVFPLNNGGYLFSWECYSDIYGQFVNSDNSKYRSIFKINSVSNSTAGFNDPKAVQLKNNEIFVTWIQQNPTYYRIYGKHYLEELIHPLLTFNLVYPQSNDTINSIIQTFHWEKPTTLHYNYSWDIDYKVYMDTIPSFENPQIYSGIYDTSFTIENLEPGTEYYWKVVAKNLGGDSLWCNKTNSFFVGQSLIPFSLLQPESDETIKMTDPFIRWNHASAQSFNSPWKLIYYLYLDENENFIDPVIYSIVRDTVCLVDSLLPGTNYFWKVLAKDSRNDSLWSSETNLFYVSEDATVSIEDQIIDTKLQCFKLFGNYPNPFNPETTVKYNLPADQSVYPVKVKIYDALGRLIITLKNKQQSPGLHTVKWNGKNTAGQNMPSGIYFFVVEARQFKAAQKMLLVR
jgi:hypothetical protein